MSPVRSVAKADGPVHFGEERGGGLYAAALRPLLFRLDPERAHELSLALLSTAAPAMARLPGPPDGDGRLEQSLFGLRFPNPIGLAAGFDKRARAVPAWPALGFGFAEIGTVTALGQPGNPRPRIHRLSADRALINRLGFNNDGAEGTARRLASWDRRGLLHRVPLGVNIGRSRVVPTERAAADYAASLARLWPYADYVAINVSSPNTPGLRDLQGAGPLGEILDAVEEVNREMTRSRGPARLPVLVKLAPDLSDEQVDAAVDLALDRGLGGVIVSNTTLARDGLRSPPELTAHEGGLSGAPLRARSTALVRRVAARAAGRLVVVGVGGVFDADDAWQKLAAGASLVQVYTGLVYGGPGTARSIAAGLLARMDREGVRHIGEMVGSEAAYPG